MTPKEEIPKVLYLYIHLKLYQRTNGSHIISIKDATLFLGKWHIPKRLRYLILRELMIMGNIEKVDYSNIEIKKPETNIENPKHFDEIMKSLSLRNS